MAVQLVLVVGVVALGQLSLVPNVADLDGFYHVGHAQAYLEGSPFDTSLPWATHSVIGDRGGDLWWGFHVLLIPVVAALDVPAAMHVAAAMLTTLLALTMLALLRRHRVRWPALWAVLFLLAVPNVSFRFLMIRPHVVSLAASLAIASFLVKGRWWHVALLSAAISWVHLSLFWMGPLLAVTYAVVRVPATVLVGRATPDTGVPIHQAIPAALAGAALGWLLRPDALTTGALLNIQLVQLFAQKAVGQPLTFAAELSPIHWMALLQSSGSFLAAWLLGVGLVVAAVMRGRLGALGQERATLVGVALVVSGAFLVLALVSARRGLEQWVAFAFLAFPLMARGVRLGRVPLRVRAAVGIVLVAHLGWFVDRHLRNRAEVSFPVRTMAPIAEYLEQNSQEGELVFHARWDNFGPLFAYNRHNRYLGGMDPIFQFAHDPRSFWEFFYLSADLTQEWTCDAYPCPQGNATDTHQVLRDHFGARWVVVQPYRNPRFTLYLLNDERYALALETQTEALFEVLP